MKNILAILLLILSNLTFAQDELLAQLEAESDTDNDVFESPAFKAMKIGNLQSTKVAKGGELYMFVSHRFGTLQDGINTFFGMDNANTKIQMLYGIVDGFQVSLGRESLRKTFAGSAKVKIKSQTNKFPLAITAYSTVNYNSEVSQTRYPFLKEIDRLSYASQLLIARRFSSKLSLEIAPSLIHQNIVWETSQHHTQFALGVGGRYKLTRRASINFDYAFNTNRVDNSLYRDPLTVGFDIETGGHIFQLLFSNAQSTNEPGFLSNAEGNWSEGNVFFGFNIVRIF